MAGCFNVFTKRFYRRLPNPGKSEHRIYLYSKYFLLAINSFLLCSCSDLPVRSNDKNSSDSHTVFSTKSASTIVDVIIDNAMEYQVMEGFGATHISLYHENTGDVLGVELRTRAIDAIYNKVGISMGNLECALLESPGDYSLRTNDNSMPDSINWNGFQTFRADAIKAKLVNLARPLGFNNYFPAQKINTRWASPWLNDLRQSNYQNYLDEIVEQVLAGVTYWRQEYGSSPRFLMLFNEPLSGNRELLNGNIQNVVDIVNSVGNSLRRKGYPDIKFIIANEATVEKSLQTITAILSDSEARKYVGAIGYHPYPYGSVYSSIARILGSSGLGKPDKNEIAIREKLYKTAHRYNLPVWMTEVSHGNVDPLSFDDLRGRAIHIHDELVYANASAYFGMNNMWDVTSHEMHYKGRNNGDIFSQEGTIVLIENDKEKIHITGMGYAIGHYARWIKKGAVRIDAQVSDPLIQVSAFRDNGGDYLTIVIINNYKAAAEKTINVKIDGLHLGQYLKGEQSTHLAYWEPLEVEADGDMASFVVKLPGESVTTLSGNIKIPAN